VITREKIGAGTNNGGKKRQNNVLPLQKIKDALTPATSAIKKILKKTAKRFDILYFMHIFVTFL
jgi:hypothetical protein